MPSWQGKSKGTPWGYRIFVGILKKWGVLPAYFLLRAVAFYYFLFSFKSSKHIFNYFYHRLGYGIVPSLVKIYSNYYLFGQGLIDKIVLMSGMPNRFTFHFDGEHHLRKIVELKRGGLLLSAHIGNWEIAGQLLSRLKTRIHIVMFDGEHQNIKDYLSEVMDKKQMNLILIKDDLSHIYQISEAFSNNELVCIHADRFMEGNKTVSCNFLGAEAKFPAGPFILAQKFRVPVSYVFAMKENKLHYHLFSSGIHEYVHLSKETIIQEMLKDFTAEMEKKVKQYPEQWYNYYNFWQQ